MERKGYDRYDSHGSSGYTSGEENSGEVLILTIDVGKGQREELIVRDTDDPAIVAGGFCRRFGLGLQACQALAKQIERNFETKPLTALMSVNKSYEIESRKSISAQSYKENSVQNPGEKLYMKGLKFIENSQRKKDKIIQEKNEKESKENTFRPRINQTKEHQTAIEEVLLKRGRETIENIEKKRGEILAQEMSECTFTPLIIQNTSVNQSSSTDHESRFDKLYENAKIVQDKKLVINEKM